MAARQRVLVTGGTGTLGFNLLRLLAEDDRYHVVAPIRNLGNPLVQILDGKITFIEHDLSDPIHTAQITERVNPDIIVHCAASGLRPPKGSWFDLMQFNVVSTMRLFQMNCRLDHPSKFIYVSTGLVYREQSKPLIEDDPIESLHPYGASKAATDLMLQAAAAEFNRKLAILRPFAFTGPHDSGKRLFPLILESAVSGEQLHLTDGTQIRDFCSVADIADGVLRVMGREQVETIEKYNLGSGLCRTIRSQIEDVCEKLQIDARLAFGERSLQSYEPRHSVADISHAKAELGWQPQTSLAYSVWELAQEIAPSLRLKRPAREFGTS